MSVLFRSVFNNFGVCMSDLIGSDFGVFVCVQSFSAMTKIVGTLGPRSRSVEVISSCLKAGMSGDWIEFSAFSFFLSIDFLSSYDVCSLSVARFDFSWGDAENHQETLENVRTAIKSTKRLCAVSLLIKFSLSRCRGFKKIKSHTHNHIYLHVLCANLLWWTYFERKKISRIYTRLVMN